MSQPTTPNPKSDENPENFESEIDQQTLETLSNVDKLEEGQPDAVKKTIDELQKKSHFEE